MQSFLFYINGNQVPEPDNWQALMLELSFENNSPDAVLNETKLVWKGPNATILQTWVSDGLSGGVGIFEGIPLVIKICDTQEVVFDGIIDLTDSETKFTCDIIQCRIRDRRMDMVSQLIDSISFAYLATPTVSGGAGVINPAPIQNGGDYVVIPYQLNGIPDYIQLVSLCLVIFTVVDKFNEVVNILTGLVNGTIAAAGLAGLGGALLGIIEIVFYVLYMIALVVIIYELLKAAFQCIVSPVFSKFGMYAKTLFEKACQYFNLGFSSTIFQNAPYDRLVIMPQKSAWANNDSFVVTLFQQFVGSINKRIEYDDYYNWQHNGSSSGNARDFGAYGYYDGTCGDFIRAMEEVFNAKAKIIMDSNGQPVLHFERWDFQYDLATYTIPNISDQVPFNSNGLFNNLGGSQSAFGTNAHELAANYMVRYSVDESDENTLGVYEGTSCYCTTRPILVNTSNIQNVLLKNLVERNIGFAHAHRKDRQTFAEIMLGPVWAIAASIFNVGAAVVNLVISVYNFLAGLFNFTPLSTIQYMPMNPPFAAIGHMLMTNHITSVPKMFIATTSDGTGQSYQNYFDFQGHSFTGVLIDPNNRDYIGARALMKNFHFSSLPLTVVPPTPYNLPYQPGQPYFNQWLTLRDQRVPLCCDDYALIKNNNIVSTWDGKKARMISAKWNPHKGIGNLNYDINWQYTTNLKTSFVIDGKETVDVL